ncbi:hypothetical protein ACFWBC_19145 [Streptomyces sp. NPDC059985]|uniref:hypothetical protein n=1 Tax=Streptomyces sp. NPDC059985 TaxID=3347025 RepID=UPI0036B21722
MLGVVVLGQTFGPVQLVGFGLALAAIIAGQLPTPPHPTPPRPYTARAFSVPSTTGNRSRIAVRVMRRSSCAGNGPTSTRRPLRSRSSIRVSMVESAKVTWRTSRTIRRTSGSAAAAAPADSSESRP